MRDGEEGEGCLRSQFREWNRFWGRSEPSGWVEEERRHDENTKPRPGNKRMLDSERAADRV